MRAFEIQVLAILFFLLSIMGSYILTHFATYELSFTQQLKEQYSKTTRVFLAMVVSLVLGFVFIWLITMGISSPANNNLEEIIIIFVSSTGLSFGIGMGLFLP